MKHFGREIITFFQQKKLLISFMAIFFLIIAGGSFLYFSNRAQPENNAGTPAPTETVAAGETTLTPVLPNPENTTAASGTPAGSVTPAVSATPVLYEHTFSSGTNYYNYCWEYECFNFPTMPLSKKTSANFPVNYTVDKNFLYAKGSYNVGVVFVYDQEPLDATIITKLTAGSSHPESFLYGAAWLKTKARNFNIDLSLNIVFENQRKVPTSSRESIIYYLRSNFPDLSKYDMLISVFYGSYSFTFNQQALATDKAIELYLSRPEGMPPGRTYPDVDENFSESVVHEILHIYGAADKYTCGYIGDCNYAVANGIGCIIDSADPAQKGRDIMCHRVPHFSGGSWSFINPPLDGLSVQETTSKELGWVDMDHDSILEINDRCPYNKANDC